MLERRQLAALQGAYFLATGLWPLVHMKSFLRVTGPKRDLWLVRTVGALIAVSGAVMLRAGRTRRVGEEIALLAAGSAVALGAVDVIYTAKRTISPIYLLDAAAEAVLVGAWASLVRGRSQFTVHGSLPITT